MKSLFTLGIISTLLLINVSVYAAQDSQPLKNVDNPIKPKPEQDVPPIKRDNVTNQQNYDKNDAGVEIQEEIDPEKIDPAHLK